MSQSPHGLRIRSWLSVLLAIGLITLLGIFALSRQSNRGGQSRESLHFPRTIDLGDIEADTPHTVEFLIENPSSQDITLEHFETSCGCMGLTLLYHDKPVSQTVVLQSLDILKVKLEVTGSASSPSEPFLHSIQSIQFRSSHPQFSNNLITIKGMAWARVYTEPAKVIERVPPNSLHRFNLTIYDQRKPTDPPIQVCVPDQSLEIMKVTPDKDQNPSVTSSGSRQLCYQVSCRIPSSERIYSTIEIRDANDIVLRTIPIELIPDVPPLIRKTQTVFKSAEAKNETTLEFIHPKFQNADVKNSPTWIQIRKEAKHWVLALDPTKPFPPQGLYRIGLDVELSTGERYAADFRIFVFNSTQGNK